MSLEYEYHYQVDKDGITYGEHLAHLEGPDIG